jgi:hypothetical protein
MGDYIVCQGCGRPFHVFTGKPIVDSFPVPTAERKSFKWCRACKESNKIG